MTNTDDDAFMTADEIVALSKKYTFWTWSAQDAVDPIPMARAQGIYFWDADGKRYIDFSSQLMCVNIGHRDERVVEAIKRQAEILPYAAPAMATQPRAEIGSLLAARTPGDLNKFFFTNGGAEANENAIKLAKQYTGRDKIITRYRSYHGATAGAITYTGDHRRWPNEPGIPGVIRVSDAYKYRSALYEEGDTDEVFARKCLDQIEEVIMFEGPENIAAVLIETITGGNGLILPVGVT